MFSSFFGGVDAEAPPDGGARPLHSVLLDELAGVKLAHAGALRRTVGDCRGCPGGCLRDAVSKTRIAMHLAP